MPLSDHQEHTSWPALNQLGTENGLQAHPVLCCDRGQWVLQLLSCCLGYTPTIAIYSQGLLNNSHTGLTSGLLSWDNSISPRIINRDNGLPPVWYGGHSTLTINYPFTICQLWVYPTRQETALFICPRVCCAEIGIIILMSWTGNW